LRRGALAVAAVVALQALPARAQEPAGAELPALARGGEVDVRAVPNRLTLGEGGEARVAVALPKGALRVKMKAAIGTIRGVKVGKGGEATGTYTPPDSFVPRVDFVVALVETRDGPKAGFAAIQLTGQGEAVLKTRPKAQARIRIGDREYGPVQADKRGEARIQIRVPPGTTIGYGEGNAPIDLGVPAVPRVAVIPMRAKVRTGAGSAVQIFVVATQPDGGPDAAAVVSLSVDRGEISAPRAIGGGAFVAAYTPPAEGDGKATITAAVEGEESPAATAVLTLVPGKGAEEIGLEQRGGADGRPPIARRLDAALKGGFASNFGAINTFHVGIDFAYELLVHAVGLRLGGDVGFSASEAEESEAVGAGTTTRATASLWIVPITGHLGCRFPFASVWSWSLRAEFGAAMMDNEIRMRTGDAAEVAVHERDWLPALGGAAELARALGPGAILAEARYLHVFREPATISGRLGLLYVNVGYRLVFNL
jgi:hypothetical protein